LTAEAAKWTGLPEGIAVAVGNVDAHVTNAAANAVNPGEMVAIMGTSTCHIMVSDVLANVPGMCGVVDGGVISGSLGYEAGQSGVGDIFGWYAKNYLPEEYTRAAAAKKQDIHTHLCEMFAGQPAGAHGLVCLDWQSGNRSTLVDHQLSGMCRVCVVCCELQNFSSLSNTVCVSDVVCIAKRRTNSDAALTSHDTYSSPPHTQD